jgi:hypothetical protein
MRSNVCQLHRAKQLAMFDMTMPCRNHSRGRWRLFGKHKHSSHCPAVCVYVCVCVCACIILGYMPMKKTHCDALCMWVCMDVCVRFCFGIHAFEDLVVILRTAKLEQAASSRPYNMMLQICMNVCMCVSRMYTHTESSPKHAGGRRGGARASRRNPSLQHGGAHSSGRCRVHSSFSYLNLCKNVQISTFPSRKVAAIMCEKVVFDMKMLCRWDLSLSYNVVKHTRWAQHPWCTNTIQR